MKRTTPKQQENELLITLHSSWVHTHFMLKNDKKQANHTPPLLSPNLLSISQFHCTKNVKEYFLTSSFISFIWKSAQFRITLQPKK